MKNGTPKMTKKERVQLEISVKVYTLWMSALEYLDEMDKKKETFEMVEEIWEKAYKNVPRSY